MANHGFDAHRVILYLDEGASIKNVLVELVENMPEVRNAVACDGKLTVKGIDVERPSYTARSAGVIDLRHPSEAV